MSSCLSDEQLAVVRIVSDGVHSVRVNACAGSGKTRTMLECAKQNPGRKFVMLVYNKQLQSETRASVSAQKIRNINVFTIHSMVGKCYESITGHHRACSSDEILFQSVCTLEEHISMMGKNTFPCDVLLIDEAQDLNPLMARAIQQYIRLHKEHVKQIVLVGDPKQALYTDKEDSLLASSNMYLEAPENHFGRMGGWVSCELSATFRLTPEMTTFVNAYWGTSMRSARPARGDATSIVFVKCNLYTKAIIDLIKDCVRKYSQREVMLLACSFKSCVHKQTPVRFLADRLSRDDVGIDVYVADHEKANAARCAKNKLRFLTYHSSKGCEARCVIVCGFDKYDDRKVSNLNPMGVALSRAKDVLIVLEGSGMKSSPYPIYNVRDHVSYSQNKYTCDGKIVNRILATINQFILADTLVYAKTITIARKALQGVYAQELVSFCDENVKGYKQLVELEDVVYSVTDRSSESLDERRRIIGLGAWDNIREACDVLEYDMYVDSRNTKNISKNTGSEEVSDLYGIFVTEIARMMCCPEYVKCMLDKLDMSNEVDASRWVNKMQMIIDNMCRNHPEKEYRYNQLAEKSCVVNYDVLQQGGQRCLEQLHSICQEHCRSFSTGNFEHAILYKLHTPYPCTYNKQLVEFVGVLDWCVDDIVYEAKMVSDITDEMKMQLVQYCLLRADEKMLATVHGYLHNIRTDELWYVCVSFEDPTSSPSNMIYRIVRSRFPEAVS